MSNLVETLYRLHEAESPEARWLVACSAFAALGGEWITAASAPCGSMQPVSVRTSTPDVLMRDYVAQDLPRRDRWIQHCAEATEIDCCDPASATSANSGLLDPRLALILSDHGVRFVALVPAGSSARIEALVVYATCSKGALMLRNAVGSELSALAALIAAFRSADASIQPASGGYRFQGILSLREREALLWLASGMRTAEIAHRMAIEPVTVGLHFSGARRKLRARTREQALAIALRDGLINP